MANDKSTHDVSPESVAAVNQLVPMDVSGRMCLDDGKPKTLSVMIIDRSGSMQKYGGTPQKCVNDHLAAIKNPPDGREQFVTVITFADDAKIEIPVSPAATAQPLETYVADGWTLLWQTVHETLKLFCTLHRMNNPTNLKVFVGVISDGDDNRSDNTIYPKKTRKWAQIALDLGFELFAYGIGVDGKKLAEDMGFPSDDQHAFTLEASVASVQEATTHFTTRSTTHVHSGFWKKP